MSEIHVALVTPWNRRGGIATYAERLVAEFGKEADIRTTIVDIENPDAMNPFEFVGLLDEIPSNADVVHVQFEAGLFGNLGMSGVGAPAFFIALKLSKLPAVVTLHEVHAEHPHRGPVSDRLLRLRDGVIEQLALRAADASIVHTSRAKEILNSRHSKRWRIERILHPTDADVDPISTDEAKAELGVEEPVALTFGFVEEKKRYEDVVRALSTLPELTYLIAGELREREGEAVLERVQELAEQFGVADQIRYLGYVNDRNVPVVFSATDVVVLPYERVSQSGVVNDALAYRRPVVASDLPAFRELKREFGCIRLYDGKCLNSILADLLRNPEQRSRLKQAASEYCNEMNWSAFRDSTVSLYTDLSEDK
jgi:glycosyltransferase involved in cell wall biosynthesis